MHSFYATGAHTYANEYGPRFRSSRACELPFLRPLPWRLPRHVFSTVTKIPLFIKEHNSFNGLGILFSTHAFKTLNCFERIQQRMMCATFHTNPYTKLTSCYSPTNANDKIDIAIIYNQLNFLVSHISKHSVLIIGGDIAAKISKDKNGKFYLHNSSKRGGEYLADFSFEKWHGCLIIKLQKEKECHELTPSQNGGKPLTLVNEFTYLGSNMSSNENDVNVSKRRT